MIQQSYLYDEKFLKKLDSLSIKDKYIKIEALDFNENVLKEIQGRSTNGSLNLSEGYNRRTASLSVVFSKDEDANVLELSNLFSLNKKIRFYIGIKNQPYMLHKYTNVDIFWFKAGTYVITTANLSQSSSGISLSLNLADKMAFLDGTCGGTFSSATTLNKRLVEDKETGEIDVEEDVPLRELVFELVNHYGGEALGRIIVNDLDTYAVKKCRWLGSTNVYGETQGTSYQLYGTGYPTSDDDYYDDSQDIYHYDDAIGYEYTPLCWCGENLIAGIGSTVAAALSQICSEALGETYEFFYDIDGNFVFQKKKNYLSQTKTILEMETEGTYPSESEISAKTRILSCYLTSRKDLISKYNFDNSDLILSYSHNPHYENIKNDFVIWGQRPQGDGQVDIRFHVAIDTKPKTGFSHEGVFFFKDPSYSTEVIKPIIPAIKFSNIQELNATFNYNNPGITDAIYNVEDKWLFTWAYFEEETPSGTENIGRVVPMIRNFDRNNDHPYFEYPRTLEDVPDLIYDESTSSILTDKIIPVVSQDWRTELLLRDLRNRAMGLKVSNYYEELIEEWPKLYDIRKGEFYLEVLENPSKIDYYLDFFDTDTDLMNFSVDKIGRRTIALQNTNINCIFEDKIKDILIISTNATDKEKDIARRVANSYGYKYCQVSEDIYSKIDIMDNQNDAYSVVLNNIYKYTNFASEVNLTTVPIYYLEPGDRITITNPRIGIYGDYVITNLSIPLGVGETMNITCSKCMDRFI